MRRSTLIVAIVVVVVGGAALYWHAHTGQNGGSKATPSLTLSPEGSSAENPAAYVTGNLLLGTDSSDGVGSYLIGYNGMTLYTYSPDMSGHSNCNGQCAVNWPPYVVSSTDFLANIQAGINGKVSTTQRSDGMLQVTYNGQPLYFYVGDHTSGDITGQGVGGVWYVVKP
ncbi:MAG TPA: hypothetical protein VFK07_00535 [Candidatus Paceibacterota bacterium]|nr:hypothetical protein [Candidatus Paceibacterota bacterium]